jgi:DNA-binding NarL/FixJ family response regulator
VAAPEQLFRELLPTSVADAYLDLIDQGSRVMSEGDPVDEDLVARHLGYLQFRGAPVLRPIDPLVAISGLLTEVHRELSVQQDLLLQGYAAAAEIHQRQLRGDEVPSLLVQTLTDPDEIAERWTTLLHTTQVEYRSISQRPAGDRPLLLPRKPGISGFVLCPAAVLVDPRAADELRAAIEAGVEVRTTRSLPIPMIVVDDHVALVGLVPDGTTAALMVRSAVLVAALTQYYDQLWAAATPVVLPESVQLPRQRQLVKKLGGSERQVLTLLAHGLKDEAIARHLSISVRTVRRHIATVMEFVDAPTRFAAGAAAQRLGLLSPPLASEEP